MKNNFTKILAVLSFTLPTVVFAQQTFKSVVGTFISLIQVLLPIVMALAVLVLFWQGTKFVWNPGDEKGRAKGRDMLLWGVITLFVMVTIWGIVAMISATFL